MLRDEVRKPEVTEVLEEAADLRDEDRVFGVFSERQFAHLLQSSAVVQSNFAHRARVAHSRLVLRDADERSDFGERPLHFAVNLSGFILCHVLNDTRVAMCGRTKAKAKE
jgi:hypothetical protein